MQKNTVFSPIHTLESPWSFSIGAFHPCYCVSCNRFNNSNRGWILNQAEDEILSTEILNF